MKSSERQVKSAFVVTATMAALIMLFLAAASVLIDPYLIFDMPRTPGFNARKPAVRTQQLLMKAEEVLRVAPSTILLGSSSVDIGLNAESDGWPTHHRPVYNLALPSGSPYMAYRYLQHVISKKPPAFVILGLDFEHFLVSDHLPEENGLLGEGEARLAIDTKGHVSATRTLQRARDIFASASSWSTFVDSVSTSYGNLTGQSHDMVSGSWRTNTKHVWGPPLPDFYFSAVNLLSFRVGPGLRRNERVDDHVRAILGLCRSHRIRVVLFINPVHADHLETIDTLGYWKMFEEWKRQMLGVVQEYAEGGFGASPQLWDFTGYGEYASEPVCAGRCRMKWFWDPMHYTPELGNLVIQSLNGKGDGNFGDKLSRGNIDAHLLSIRRMQLAYRKNHPDAAKRVQDSFQLVHHY